MGRFARFAGITKKLVVAEMFDIMCSRKDGSGICLAIYATIWADAGRALVPNTWMLQVAAIPFCGTVERLENIHIPNPSPTIAARKKRSPLQSI